MFSYKGVIHNDSVSSRRLSSSPSPSSSPASSLTSSSSSLCGFGRPAEFVGGGRFDDTTSSKRRNSLASSVSASASSSIGYCRPDDWVGSHHRLNKSLMKKRSWKPKSTTATRSTSPSEKEKRETSLLKSSTCSFHESEPTLRFQPNDNNDDDDDTETVTSIVSSSSTIGYGRPDDWFGSHHRKKTAQQRRSWRIKSSVKEIYDDTNTESTATNKNMRKINPFMVQKETAVVDTATDDEKVLYDKDDEMILPLQQTNGQNDHDSLFNNSIGDFIITTNKITKQNRTMMDSSSYSILTDDSCSSKSKFTDALEMWQGSINSSPGGDERPIFESSITSIINNNNNNKVEIDAGDIESDDDDDDEEEESTTSSEKQEAGLWFEKSFVASIEEDGEMVQEEVQEETSHQGTSAYSSNTRPDVWIGEVTSRKPVQRSWRIKKSIVVVDDADTQNDDEEVDTTKRHFGDDTFLPTLISESIYSSSSSISSSNNGNDESYTTTRTFSSIESSTSLKNKPMDGAGNIISNSNNRISGSSNNNNHVIQIQNMLKSKNSIHYAVH